MLSRKNQNILREGAVQSLMRVLADADCDVLRVGSGKVCYPVVVDGEEGYVMLTVSIPKGSDGEEFDGYAEAEAYKVEAAAKAEKAEEKAKAKAEKIAKDKAKREKDE